MTRSVDARSLWSSIELLNCLKCMLRSAGSTQRVLMAVEKCKGSATCFFAGNDWSAVEQSVAALDCCLLGHTDLLRALLDNGVSVSVADLKGRTALHLAALFGDAESTRLLVERGADVNQWDQSRRVTPLVAAAAAGCLEVLQYLLQAGARVNLGAESFDVALLYAVRENAIECVNSLLNAGAKTGASDANMETPLHVAASYGFDRCVNALLINGAVPNLVDMSSDNETPLHLAIKGGYVACAELLLAYNADFKLETKRGRAPIHLAACTESPDLIELLLKRGVDVNSRDLELRTPLHCCFGKGRRPIENIETLLRHGARVNAADNVGCTPLHLAAINEMAACAELLLDYGADMTARNKGGICCLNLIQSRVPSVLRNLPSRFDKAISLCENRDLVEDRHSELRMDFNILVAQSGRECELLKGLIDIGEKEIIKHPLCGCLLHLKWTKVRKFLFFNVIVYLMFCSFISCYALATSRGSCFNAGVSLMRNNCRSFPDEHVSILAERCLHPNYNISITCSVVKGELFVVDVCECMSSWLHQVSFFYPGALDFIWYLLIVFAFCLAVCEIFWLLQDQHQYLRNPENAMEWLILFLVSLIGSPLFGHIEEWQKHIAAIVILLCWLKLMMLVGRMPRFGLYIHMLSLVLHDFFQFIMSYISLAIGCALAFPILFPKCISFGGPFESLLKVLVMLTGEYSYDELFFSKDSYSVLNPTAMLVFVVFLFVVAIILMNLLVALAVSDIQHLRKSGSLNRLIRLTKQISHIEATLFSPFSQAFLPRFVISMIIQGALVACAPQSHTLVFHYNDPNDRRLTRDLTTAACRLARHRTTTIVKERGKHLRMTIRAHHRSSSLDFDDESDAFTNDQRYDNVSNRRLMSHLERTDKKIDVLFEELRSLSSRFPKLK